MELKDFVKATLEQIVEGAAMAQSSIESQGGIINPSSMQYQKDGQWNIYSDCSCFIRWNDKTCACI